MKNLINIFIYSLLLSLPLYAEDWPQWRGTQRDGVWRESGIITSFPSKKLTPIWKAKISGGYSGPSVADGKVYITDRISEPQEIERVLCFDEKTGKKIWSHEYPCVYKEVDFPIGPRTNVSIDHGKCYSLGTMGHLFCFDTSNGHIVWEKDLYNEYQIRMPTWGISGSPLVYRDLVIVQIGGKDNACMVAFDKNNGKEIWRNLKDRNTYVSPIIIQQANQDVLVTWTRERVVGMNPLTGKLYWHVPFESHSGITTPTYDPPYLFVSSFDHGGCTIKINPTELKAEKLWLRKGPTSIRTDSLHSLISTPILKDKHIYGIDSYGQLRCLKTETGDRLWEETSVVPKARFASAHLIQHEEKTWIFNERGELIIANLTPEGYKEISRTQLIEPTRGQYNKRGGVCWSHPAFANKHVYIRNDEYLICVSLAK